MTVPHERYLATKRAKDFLGKLLDPAQTPRVPRALRMEARAILKHFPMDYDLDRAAEKAPEVFSKKF